ncbi:hypothetical protein ACWED2_46180 [Amycolatopsis sp. NPDC005003]
MKPTDERWHELLWAAPLLHPPGGDTCAAVEAAAKALEAAK